MDRNHKWTVRSFAAVVRAKAPEWLLGGVKEHESSRFARREDAEAWAATVMRANGDRVANVEIIRSTLPPEIDENGEVVR